MSEIKDKVVSLEILKVAYDELKEETGQLSEEIGDFNINLMASSVMWNQTPLDIANDYRTRKAVLLSTNGNLAHNACACLCANVIANVWAENTDGGTSDNANSDGQVHSKLRFTYDRLGVMHKINANSIDVDSVTYDLFPVGTEIVGVDGNSYTVLSDSDNMILYVNSMLHIFSMVYGSDGNTHIVHTSGTVTRKATTVTWTPTNIFTEVSLSVNDVLGTYDFTRINSEWMKVPQINTQPSVRTNDTYFALSINGKGIAIISFDNTDVTIWKYQKFIESSDINLEVSLVNVSWVSNTYPVWVTAHRTKKGYAKIIGYNNDFEILQKYTMPASNTRVRLFGANSIGASSVIFLACGDSGRNTGSIYMYDLSTTPNLSKSVCIWHSNSNITDYISGFLSKTSVNSYMYLIGTNKSAIKKNGVSANCMFWNVDLYSDYSDNLFSLLGVTDGDEVSY